jgi:hypothetical protein
MQTYIAVFGKLVCGKKIYENCRALIACLLKVLQHHHNTLAHQNPTVCSQHSSTTTTL